MANISREKAYLACVVTALVLGCVPVVSAQDRMPPIPADEMTEAQREIAAKYEAERGSTIRTGPWVPLLRTPEILRLMLDMRTHVRDHTLLGPRLSEFGAGMDATIRVECSPPGGGPRRVEPGDHHGARGRPAPTADGRRRGDPLRPVYGTAPE